MTFSHFIQSLVLGAAAVQLASAGFTLDQIYPDWSYTSGSLWPGTSKVCKAAYRAEIDCDETLLGLAASMRVVFKPTPSHLDLTCTATCKASVDAYLLNLIKSCSGPDDGALKKLDSGNSNNISSKLEPVYAVAWILQYVLARSCMKNALTQEYCYFTMGSANNKFSCEDSCNLQFYTLAHNYPGSKWFFNYYFLLDQSPWWEQYFIPGWEVAASCGAKEEKPAYADPKAVLAAAPTTTVPSVSASAASNSRKTGTEDADERAAASGTAEAGFGGSASSTASGPRQTSGAGKLRSPFARLL